MKTLSHFRHFSNILSHNMGTELEYIMHYMMQWSLISYNCTGNLNIWNAVATEIFLTKNQIFVSYIAEVHTQFEHFRSRSTLYGISTVSYLIAFSSILFKISCCLISVYLLHIFIFHCMFWNFHPARDGGDCWFLSFARNTWCSSLRSEWYYP